MQDINPCPAQDAAGSHQSLSLPLLGSPQSESLLCEALLSKQHLPHPLIPGTGALGRLGLG